MLAKDSGRITSKREVIPTDQPDAIALCARFILRNGAWKRGSAR